MLGRGRESAENFAAARVCISRRRSLYAYIIPVARRNKDGRQRWCGPLSRETVKVGKHAAIFPEI
jgi:hypothetical protein